MHTSYLIEKATQTCFCLLFSVSTALGQSSEPATIDLQKVKRIVDSLDKQFSKHYFHGDSIALYNMYAKDAFFGSLKVNDILLAWGKMIRNSIKNDSRNLVFTTTSLIAEADFLVELGKYEMKDNKGNLKENGKYLVVWKNENGDWKLYRDIGL